MISELIQTTATEQTDNKMGVPKRINDFVTTGEGMYCDMCIQSALRIARTAQVQPVTATLGTTRDFTRRRGECDICKSFRLVIRRV
jgi:hypothetical protein